MPPPYANPAARNNGGYTRQESFENRAARPTRGPPAFAPPSLGRKPTFARQAPIHRGATLRQRVPNGGVDERGPPGLGGSSGTAKLARGKTLTRPDRHVAPAPLISATPATAAAQVQRGSWFKPWTAFAHICTFWAPPFILAACGMRDKPSRQAWREKFALCLIAVLMGGFVGFATIGLNRVLCPVSGSSTPDEFIRLGEIGGFVGIQGWVFNVTNSLVDKVNFFTLAQQLSGQDVTDLFDQSAIAQPKCAGQTGAYATANLCATNATATPTAACPLGALSPTTFQQVRITNTTKQVGWSWEQIAAAPNYMVIDGNVLNLTPYMALHPTPIANDSVDAAIRYVLRDMNPASGRDGTRIFFNRPALSTAARCIIQRYRAGHIDKITPGCFASQLFLYVSLFVIMSVVLARFAMAVVFNWFLSRKLVQPPKDLKGRHAVSPAVMPAGANLEVDNTTGTAPWTEKANKLARTRHGEKGTPRMNEKTGAVTSGGKSGNTGAVDANGMIDMGAIGAELFCACLVTCYSEGEESIRGTLDAISGATYSDARKLIFLVADGMITGSGEKRSTPDICVGLLDADPRFGNPTPMSYLAVAAGKKAHNQALVYAGHYTSVKGRRTPTIIVVKCGAPEEAGDKKPGNRGKRDSQMILMNFFSRVTYNDRMTPLDYDLFRKSQALMGVTPDFFEVVLMVDADTKVYPDSLTQLVNCMQHDNTIMGVCGETRIANKRQSWVTAIQVYEYFISHHLAKAFESVFGGVTCLPGCFSMYRLKARKLNDSDWVPILCQSEISREYSQSVVTTLHQKNLLLLGEDRFLSTLMIRTFPARKMMFCPQAKCRTVAPDEFKVLLSQRRRWINSTIHNLMELVRVQNLCGTFCFSMQFVVFMELLGTVVLPVAICLTYTLIINYAFHPPTDFSDAIPLLLLAGVLGLPAILILLTTRKIVYLLWMLIYLLALPVWNFVLPVYAFWHFDDFSWGETRKVQGEGKDVSHKADGGASIEVNAVPLRRWDAWEKSRLRKIKRDAKRRKDFERAFGSQLFHNTPGAVSEYESSRMDSETASMTSREEDKWGMQIGQYHEEDPAGLPPVGLYGLGSNDSGPALHQDQMAAMLDEGWDEDEDEDITKHSNVMSSAVDYYPINGQASPRPSSPYGTSDGGYTNAHSSSSLVPLARDASPVNSGIGNGHPEYAPNRSAAPSYTSSVDQPHARKRSAGTQDFRDFI